jgi:hypothetical protein
MTFFTNFCCNGPQLPFSRRAAVDLEVSPHEKPAYGPFVPPLDLSLIDRTDPTKYSEGEKSSYPFADTAKIALSLLQATLDSVPVPGLKGIIGGVLLIIDKFDVCESSRRRRLRPESLRNRSRKQTRQILSLPILRTTSRISKDYCRSTGTPRKSLRIWQTSSLP